MKMSTVNKIFAVFCVLGILASLNASNSIYAMLDTTPPEYYIVFVLVIGIILLIIFSLIRYAIEQTKCPSCGAVLQREFMGRDVVSEKTGYKTVTRRARDKHGKVVSRWEDQIRTKTVEYQNHFKCANCGHEWTTSSVEEYDSFED